MLIKNIFSKNSAWVLGFAVAAIFATTFVSCGGGDTVNNYGGGGDKDEIPYTLTGTSDAAAITFYFEFGYKKVIVLPSSGNEALTVDANIILSEGRTLDLGKCRMDVSTGGAIVMGGGTLVAEAGKATISSGNVYVKDESAKAAIASYFTNADQIDTANEDGIAGGVVLYGNYSDAAESPLDISGVKLIFGNFAITTAADFAASGLSALEAIYGEMTITGDNTTAYSVTLGSALFVDKGIDITKKANLVANSGGTTLTLGGEGLTFEEGGEVSIGTGDLTVNGKVAGVAKLAEKKLIVNGVWDISPGLKIVNGEVDPGSSTKAVGVVNADGKKSFDVADLTIEGMTIDGSQVTTIKSGSTFSLTNTSITNGDYASATGFTNVTVGAGGVVHESADILTVGESGYFKAATLKVAATDTATITSGGGEVAGTVTLAKTLVKTAGNLTIVSGGSLVVASAGTLTNTADNIILTKGSSLDVASSHAEGFAIAATIVLKGKLTNTTVSGGAADITLGAAVPASRTLELDEGGTLAVGADLGVAGKFVVKGAVTVAAQKKITVAPLGILDLGGVGEITLTHGASTATNAGKVVLEAASATAANGGGGKLILGGEGTVDAVIVNTTVASKGTATVAENGVAFIFGDSAATTDFVSSAIPATGETAIMLKSLEASTSSGGTSGVITLLGPVNNNNGKC